MMNRKPWKLGRKMGLGLAVDGPFDGQPHKCIFNNN